MNISQGSQDRKLTEREKNARVELNRAVSLHMQGNKAGALKAIRQALALDPNLAQEKLTLNLAKELTGLPVSEAVALLANADASKTIIKSARIEERQASSDKPVSLAVYALAALTLALVGMVIFGVAIGQFKSSIAKLSLIQQESQKYNAGGYEYYMAVPSGSAPTGGWPVVVALHGMGGQGSDMMWLADNFTKAGAIFVAPTFLEYAPNPGDGPIAPMSEILAQVGLKHPVKTRGAVLLGFSQGGAFAFRFSLRHPEQVYAVVTAGAPEYDQFFPPPSTMPYVFTWGASDGLQDFVIPAHVQPLQSAGYNITTFIVPGYGHEVSPFAIERTLNFIR